MAKNNNLHCAKKAKNDEFYTRLTDIEKELVHYKEFFKDKIVYCNCDDDEESQFWKYFELCFEHLGLKKLIATHYDSEKPTYKIELTKDINGDGKVTKEDIVKTPLKSNGDFRSEECIELLKEADIVVTNPPFSLFREYIDQLIRYNKKFLIIGNPNAITYKEIFPLIKDNKLWVGYKSMGADMLFTTSKEYEQELRATKKEGSGYRIIDGNFYARASAIWFTNLPTKKRNEELILFRKYDPVTYPTYDNYDAINVDKVADIPEDYNGVMGVPITFLDSYCPKQFEIIALGNSRENFTPNKDYVNPIKHTKDGKEVSGGAINCVLAINQKTKPVNTVFYTSDNSDYLVPPYARILIKKKQ